MASVQVLDFEDNCLLIRHGRLLYGFCSSGQRFASGFLQIPPRGGHPCRSANSSPCRACRGIAPPSRCTLPGAQQKKHLRRSRKCLILWCRGTESNCRHGDFQTKFLKIRKFCNYKQLILFQFFRLFLVSVGTFWRYLTLTGTIWAQFNRILPPTLLFTSTKSDQT